MVQIYLTRGACFQVSDFFFNNIKSYVIYHNHLFTSFEEEVGWLNDLATILNHDKGVYFCVFSAFFILSVCKRTHENYISKGCIRITKFYTSSVQESLAEYLT